MDWQGKCDEEFDKMVSGKSSRCDYVAALDKFYGEMDEAVQKKLRRRMDFSKKNAGRSLGTFALSIYDGTFREQLFINIWLTYLRDNFNYTKLDFLNAGVDNSGRLIIDGKTGGGDFRVDAEGVGPLESGISIVEVKFCPCDWKATYKVADLEGYLAERANVVTIFGKTMVGPNGNPKNTQLAAADITVSDLQWALFTPHIISRLLAEWPRRSCREVGGKLAIQLFKREFSQFFTLYKF